ncbi:hypothetical protein A3H65_02725 [Candidatus Giovannonibacteria bacterium RIFCSPLOWO2_02_FULL_45_14]|uniref:Uncharacterized protein n=3 Tax=Parcubacteria group TaxID=1794811 RepID=A0A1F5Y204_9BACT|nr:MAG: hypothetical protein A3C75_01140 [Candidatus Giovannonibacteria bacterium RIFCSPHIGHO2_02_FULL_44_31]OGF76971.1 MAG: hypothetical protein A3E62_01380 [Candidatus Giovannonibacteria bacterium RIFCSPHIGHO2_12_FULL_44_29]OGF90472.1 MAG: hypothetical protein A3H65_02725 [Candidatus Giovannonibacteria bacterium RIFCSPLOWO2_02_FULL_45_14]OGF93901.1 MAG: hypothetical protein A3G54_02960 [Candidatus Giovannonibacteria bacterium RIFCSPLOWO2_12_FULL_44_15]
MEGGLMAIRRFTQHATDRVRLGDENGLRTTLTLDEIAEILDSGEYAYYGSGERIFYSKKDKKFLVAVVTPDGTVVTVKPGDSAPDKLRALAIMRTAGLMKPLVREEKKDST